MEEIAMRKLKGLNSVKFKNNLKLNSRFIKQEGAKKNGPAYQLIDHVVFWNLKLKQ
jgi:hypothetical protein